MKKVDFQITSEGDLEVALLYENHDLLSEIISADYYVLLGSPSCEARFHTSATFWSFLVRVDELLSAGKDNVRISGLSNSLSLLDATWWFCGRYKNEAVAAGLLVACEELRQWAETTPVFSFWCGSLDKQIEFPLSRRTMINFAANLHKHSLFRLGRLMTRLRSLCEQSGLAVSGLDIIAVREPFIEELRNRLLYLASWLVELLGAYLTGLNSVINNRYELDKTNDTRLMHIPAGVTSEALRDLYGSTIVFHNYDPERIRRHVPIVSQNLKCLY